MLVADEYTIDGITRAILAAEEIRGQKNRE
jgi:hypothetical protein